MKIDFKKNIDVQALFEEISSTVVSFDNEKVTFSPIEYKKNLWLLRSSLVFDKQYSKELMAEILDESIRKAIIQNSLDREKFLEVVESTFNKNYKGKLSTYLLLGSLAINRLPLKSVKVGKCEIKCHGKKFPKKFIESRNDFFTHHRFKPDENEFLKFSIRITGDNYEVAANEAFESLEVFRAIINLLINPEIKFHFPEKPRAIINSILIGEYWTLHHPEGSMVERNFCLYEIDYQKRPVYTLNAEQFDYLKGILKIQLNRFNTCRPSHQKALLKAFCNYVRAFDNAHHELTFMNSWTVLETLTKTDKNDSIQKRILTLVHSDNKRLSKLQLSALINLRNSYVHELDYDHDFHTACFYVHGFIHILIFYFHFPMAGEFSSMDEAVQYLDLIKTANISLLKNRRLKNDFIKKL